MTYLINKNLYSTGGMSSGGYGSSGGGELIHTDYYY